MRHTGTYKQCDARSKLNVHAGSSMYDRDVLPIASVSAHISMVLMPSSAVTPRSQGGMWDETMRQSSRHTTATSSLYLCVFRTESSKRGFRYRRFAQRLHKAEATCPSVRGVYDVRRSFDVRRSSRVVGPHFQAETASSPFRDCEIVTAGSFAPPNKYVLLYSLTPYLVLNSSTAAMVPHTHGASTAHFVVETSAAAAAVISALRVRRNFLS